MPAGGGCRRKSSTMKNHEAHEVSATLSKNYAHAKEKPPGKWHYKAILIVTILFFSHLYQAWAQNAYAVHANIIYHFTKYINWPDDKKTGEFVIGVVGDTPLYEELMNLTSKRSEAGQPIVIKRFAANASLYNCHILFVAEDRKSVV